MLLAQLIARASESESNVNPQSRSSITMSNKQSWNHVFVAGHSRHTAAESAVYKGTMYARRPEVYVVAR